MKEYLAGEEAMSESESATPLERNISEDVVSAASSAEALPVIFDWYDKVGMVGSLCRVINLSCKNVYFALLQYAARI